MFSDAACVTYIKTQKDIAAKRKVGFRTCKLNSKAQFVYDYKMEKGKCEACCRIITKETAGAFDFDHLDRTQKVGCVSKMTLQGRYTLDDIILELKKTRLLCRNCHRKHTFMQMMGRGDGLEVHSGSVAETV